MTAPTADPGSFDDAVACLAAARTLADLAPGDPRAVYRRWVRIVHPDAAPPGRASAAAAAFATLRTLHERATAAPVLTGGRPIGPLVAAGDLADLYAVGDDALLKVPRQPADNDLLAAEAHALTTLATDGDPRFAPYAPRLVETVTLEDPETGVRRTANLLERQPGVVSLADLARTHPQGLDPRDAAWMWRRLLVALGWAHRAGVVHGAVLPAHVLIDPVEHGLVLVDWCYAVAPQQTIPALVRAHRADYPPEVPGRRPATAATDIHLATRTMRRLVGPRLPAALRRFTDGCLYDAPRMRPQDAWALLAELDDLLHALYGRRTFRPFTP